MHAPIILMLELFTSYFVTELLGTDLHRLLQSRPLEKQFIQYFLYQTLVSIKLHINKEGEKRTDLMLF